ncbi:hypothetical protein KSP40_PGU019765 [Platanthera guangdongensis]|uniref:Uncharacterized protein n=1 Tax=Platanthera guangdongensis TaxID=2320717 RepID=A0ABR2ML77_9ASPA
MYDTHPLLISVGRRFENGARLKKFPPHEPTSTSLRAVVVITIHDSHVPAYSSDPSLPSRASGVASSPPRLLRSKRAAGSHPGDSTAGGHPSRADPPPGDLLVEVWSRSDPWSGGRSARAWAARDRHRRPYGFWKECMMSSYTRNQCMILDTTLHFFMSRAVKDGA